ncbi:MAG: SAM-dependent methyltransferase [Parachlamydiaceae bacterium]|nr:SAM-dependent methyltransferase [Parachlamydiaceae bacterium]
MPTSSKVKKQLFQIPLTPAPGTIYELGSGWGTIAFILAKKYPLHRIEAYETSWIPYYFCLLRKNFNKSSNLHFYRRNFYSVRLSNASMIFCYLFPAAMQRLLPKFHQELPQGCIVVSHTFALPGSKPHLTIEVSDLYRTKIYVYHI